MAIDAVGALGRAWFKKESVYGTDAIDNNSIPVYFSSESMTHNANIAKDPSILGDRAENDQYATQENNTGDVNIVCYPVSLGHYLYHTFGKVKSVTAKVPDGTIVIYYNGAEESCLIAKSGTNLTSVVGDLGAEGADANFGAAGTIDLTNASYDTLSELATAIDGFTGYAAYYIGTGTSDTSTIADFTVVQIAGQSLIKDLIPAGASSGYVHIFQPTNYTTNLPSQSWCFDRVVRIEKFLGEKVNKFDLTIDPTNLLTGSLSLTGQSHNYVGESAPVVSMDTTKPFVAVDWDLYINGVKNTDTADIKVSLNNNLSGDKKQIGSNYFREPFVQGWSCELSMTVYWNTNTDDLIDARYTSTEKEFVLIGTSKGYIEGIKPYTMIIRIPKGKITDGDPQISGKETMLPTLKVEAFKPDKTDYEVTEVYYTSLVSDYTA